MTLPTKCRRRKWTARATIYQSALKHVDMKDWYNILSAISGIFQVLFTMTWSDVVFCELVMTSLKKTRQTRSERGETGACPHANRQRFHVTTLNPARWDAPLYRYRAPVGLPPIALPHPNLQPKFFPAAPQPLQLQNLARLSFFLLLPIFNFHHHPASPNPILVSSRFLPSTSTQHNHILPLCPDDTTINRKLESLILREMQLDMYVSLNDNVFAYSRRTSSICLGQSG